MGFIDRKIGKSYNITMNEIQPPVGEKTALVAIIGRPSSGKSTFLNTARGEKVSIVSFNLNEYMYDFSTCLPVIFSIAFL